MSTIPAETVAGAAYHGTGNEFVLVDAEEPVTARRAFARRVCDRDEGVGADGVLFLALEPDFTPPRVVMTLVQPDGSTAPMCGNGARCAAAWAMDRTGSDRVMIDTQAGSRYAERIDAGAEGPDRIAVEMARPSFDPDAVPIRASAPVVDRPARELEIPTDEAAVLGDDPTNSGNSLRVSAVDTGVPHVVAFVDDVAAVDLDRLGPAIRHADAFPRGTNVTVAGRVPDPADAGDEATFRQRTYERGVEGETAACGTGAVAIAAAAARLDRSPSADEWILQPPGGDLVVRFDERGRAVLRGPVVAGSTVEIPATGSVHR